MIDELTVTPLTVFVGSTVTLTAVGSDPDDGPSPLSYYWATTGGVIDNPIAPNATLTSATPGTFTVKLTVSDGDATDHRHHDRDLRRIREAADGGGQRRGVRSGPTSC